MGTWGVKVFDSDLALDVKSHFVETWHESRDDAEATRAFLGRWRGSLDDPEDGPVIWLALAAFQSSVGRLDGKVAKKALELIANGGALGPFRGTADHDARAKELRRLEKKLRGAQPDPKPMPRLAKTVDTELRVGDVILWKTPKGNVLLWVFGIDEQSTGTCPRLELLAWTGDRPPEDLSRLPAAQHAGSYHSSSVGHGNVWFLVFDLKRRRDREGRYELVASGFERGDWVETRASKYGLGCSAVQYQGKAPSFERQLERYITVG